MIVEDRLYGIYKIKDSVILELMKTAPVQRLRGISQELFPKEFYEKYNVYYTRYEHSVGVMLLLRKLGASIEEQSAGLIHDVSHTAFSHIIDYIIGDIKNQDYQDSMHKRYISESRIPYILKKNGFDPDRITDLENFGLLERKIPDLCADRLDYTFRVAHYTSKSLRSKALQCINNLDVRKGEIVFKSMRCASIFGNMYMKFQNRNWGGKYHVARTYFFSRILKLAMDKNIISMKDFYNNDAHVLSKISRSKDEDLKGMLTSFARNKLRIDGTHGVRLRAKFRYVDPKFVMGNGLCNLSSVDASYKKLLARSRVDSDIGVKVEIVPFGSRSARAL